MNLSKMRNRVYFAEEVEMNRCVSRTCPCLISMYDVNTHGQMSCRKAASSL